MNLNVTSSLDSVTNPRISDLVYINKNVISPSQYFKQNYDPNKYCLFMYYMNSDYTSYASFSNNTITFVKCLFDLDLCRAFVERIENKCSGFFIEMIEPTVLELIELLKLFKGKFVINLFINSYLALSSNSRLALLFDEEDSANYMNMSLIKAVFQIGLFDEYHINCPENCRYLVSQILFRFYAVKFLYHGVFFQKKQNVFIKESKGDVDLEYESRLPYNILVLMTSKSRVGTRSKLKKLPFEIIGLVFKMITRLYRFIDNE